MRRLLTGAWRVLRLPVVAALALLLWFEEWGWRPLAAWLGRLARWPPLAWLEARLRRAPPRLALVLFIVPALALLPIKLLALGLIHRGHAMLGLTVIIVAKLLGTALLGRLFVLTEPQLRQFAWFARGLDAWAGYKRRVKAWVRASEPWRLAAAVVARLRRRLRRAFAGRD